MPVSVTCSFCGKHMKAADEYAGNKMKCPDCGAILSIPLDGVANAAVASEDVPSFLGRRISASGEVTNKLDLRCPRCESRMAANAIICLECGHNRQTGQQLATVRKRFERRWYGWPNREARALMLVVVGGFFLIFCLWAWYAIDLGAGIAMAITLFLLIGIPHFLKAGTFMTAALHRDERQHAILTTTRRIGFWPMPSKTYDLTGYQRIHFDIKESNDSTFDRCVLLVLFGCGVVPGFLVWWFLSGDWYTLKLAVKGEQPVPVYQSHSESEVRDIADAISQVGKLKYG